MTAWFVSWHTSRDPFAPLLPVTGYIFLGIGIRGIAVPEGWLPDNYNLPLSNQWLTVFVWLLGTLAIICCCLGYRSRTGVLIGRRPSSESWSGRHMPKEILVSFSIICVLIGTLSLVLLRHRFAVLQDSGRHRQRWHRGRSEGGLFGIDVLAYFPLLGALLTWRVEVSASPAKLALWPIWSWLSRGSHRRKEGLLFELDPGLLRLRHYLRKRIGGRTLVLLAIPALFVVSLAFYFKDYGFKTHSIEAPVLRPAGLGRGGRPLGQPVLSI